MKLWGVVAEVNERDLVISLPGGLRGLVRASDAVDPVSENDVEVVVNDFVEISAVQFHRNFGDIIVIGGNFGKNYESYGNLFKIIFLIF